LLDSSIDSSCTIGRASNWTLNSASSFSLSANLSLNSFRDFLRPSSSWWVFFLLFPPLPLLPPCSELSAAALDFSRSALRELFSLFSSLIVTCRAALSCSRVALVALSSVSWVSSSLSSRPLRFSTSPPFLLRPPLLRRPLSLSISARSSSFSERCLLESWDLLDSSIDSSCTIGRASNWTLNSASSFSLSANLSLNSFRDFLRPSSSWWVFFLLFPPLPLFPPCSELSAAALAFSRSALRPLFSVFNSSIVTWSRPFSSSWFFRWCFNFSSSWECLWSCSECSSVLGFSNETFISSSFSLIKSWIVARSFSISSSLTLTSSWSFSNSCPCLLGACSLCSGAVLFFFPPFLPLPLPPVKFVSMFTTTFSSSWACLLCCALKTSNSSFNFSISVSFTAIFPSNPSTSPFHLLIKSAWSHSLSFSIIFSTTIFCGEVGSLWAFSKSSFNLSISSSFLDNKVP